MLVPSVQVSLDLNLPGLCDLVILRDERESTMLLAVPFPRLSAITSTNTQVTLYYHSPRSIGLLALTHNPRVSSWSSRVKSRDFGDSGPSHRPSQRANRCPRNCKQGTGKVRCSCVHFSFDSKQAGTEDREGLTRQTRADFIHSQ